MIQSKQSRAIAADSSRQGCTLAAAGSIAQGAGAEERLGRGGAVGWATLPVCSDIPALNLRGGQPTQSKVSTQQTLRDCANTHRRALCAMHWWKNLRKVTYNCTVALIKFASRILLTKEIPYPMTVEFFLIAVFFLGELLSANSRYLPNYLKYSFFYQLVPGTSNMFIPNSTVLAVLLKIGGRCTHTVLEYLCIRVLNLALNLEPLNFSTLSRVEPPRPPRADLKSCECS